MIVRLTGNPFAMLDRAAIELQHCALQNADEDSGLLGNRIADFSSNLWLAEHAADTSLRQFLELYQLDQAASYLSRLERRAGR